MYDEKILKRLGYYLLMEDAQKQEFKKMLYQMLKEEDIKKVVEKKEKKIKKRQDERYELVENMINEQLQQIYKNEQIQK